MLLLNNPYAFIIMFKDYYLILGIGSDATPEEIEQAYKKADARINVKGFVSKDFHDIQEAYSILSRPELKASYDKEFDKFNASGNYDNYSIEDDRLADKISTLQNNISEKADNHNGLAAKIGKGCMWAFIIVVIFLFSTCFSAIMKQKGRNAVRNRFSYVMPQKSAISHVYQLL